jgi:hypothetical protein
MMRTLTTPTTARLLATATFALTAFAGAALAGEGGGLPPPPPPPSFGAHLQVDAQPGGLVDLRAQSGTPSSLERGVVGDSYAKAEVNLSPAPFARAQATNNSEAGTSQAIATFQYDITVTAPDQAHALLLLSQLSTPGAIATAFGHAEVATFGGEGNVEITTGGNGSAPFRTFYGCQDDGVGPDCGQHTFDMPLFFTQSATNSLLFVSNFSASAEADAFNVLGASAFAYVDPMITLNFDLAAEGFTLTLADGSSVGNALPGAGAGAPEPAAWALMIVGFGGMGAALRRRRSARAMPI